MFSNLTCDLLVDFSQTAPDSSAIRDVIAGLARPDGLGAIIGRATCILPVGMEEAPQLPQWRFALAAETMAASNSALESAARLQRPLVVILGPLLAGNEPVSALVEALGADPMFGFAIARVQDRRGTLAKLSACLGDPEIASLPRTLLSALTERYIVPEVVGACFVVRSEVVSNFGELDSRFESTTGAWAHYLSRARRVGFRGVIVNRSVVESVTSTDQVILCVPANDYWNAHRQFPDVEFARQEFVDLAAHDYESLLARTLSKDEHKRKTILLDARGLPPFFNGTADCILGILKGLAACATDWHIGVLIKAEASAFHHVPERFPQWTFFERIPTQRFSIALRLSQPWEVQTLVELHGLALLNFYLILDTISWDILYGGPLRKELETTWGFVTENADGLLYISDYTRQRFAMRFPPLPSVQHYVSYLPFHPDDYIEPRVAPVADGEYLLVVGNNLDHKWVAPTVESLATAFPFHPIRALGCESANQPNVKDIRSGDLSEVEVARLYAEAKIVIFPSFYEGFGLPILTGLSYGKAVVARRSSLLQELAARCRAVGQLYAFSDPWELLEIVGGLLHGQHLDPLPLGQTLERGQEPLRWSDVARNILEFIENSLQTPWQSQSSRRTHQFRLRRGQGACV